MRTLLVSLVLLSATAHAQLPRAATERALSLPKRTENTVLRAGIKPSWLPDGQHLWYRVQTARDKHEFVLTDLTTGERKTAASLRDLGIDGTALKTSELKTETHPTQRTGQASLVRFVNEMKEDAEIFWINQKGARISYGRIPFKADREIRSHEGHVWLITTGKGEPLAAVELSANDTTITIDGKSTTAAAPTKVTAPAPPESAPSPDGKWTAFIRQGRVGLADKVSGQTFSLNTPMDGKTPFVGKPAWAPDSSCFVVMNTPEVTERKITLIESSPADGVQPKRHEIPYAKPGDLLPKPRPVLFRVSDQKHLVIDDSLFKEPFITSRTLSIRWAPDSSEFFFDYNQRGHQLYRIIGVNAHSGEARTVIEETSKTFIDYTKKTWRHWLDKTGELLWMSERDSWAHLWLIDTKSGRIKNQITKGEWLVRSVEHVDETARQIWFMSGGLRPDEDPYQRHLCRVNFDGTGFIQLTQGDGDHEVQFSPDRRFFVDEWSRADAPPITELRRGDTGERVCLLEKADITPLLAEGWTLPERFVAKGRDGKTDVHGVMVRPSDFDPAKKYPVLEMVYAGPHDAFSPKRFGRMLKEHQMAEMGFILVRADGMGTNHRGKDFHDVCWKNLKDAGFPDRIAWIKAAAADRPWMDLTRVGIFGGSAGGQNAMRALLDHNDFYQVAVADCGCHDNRMDKIWWNEQWMGWPVDDSYKRSSNVEDAAKLKGHLLLIVGELDRNVDPASTMQVVSALQKAGRPFTFMPIAGAGHGAAETPYGSRFRIEFLASHLLGPQP